MLTAQPTSKRCAAPIPMAKWAALLVVVVVGVLLQGRPSLLGCRSEHRQMACDARALGMSRSKGSRGRFRRSGAPVVSARGHGGGKARP
jgi:hypothetical protein